MKRYVCTVVAGFVLALTSTATASAEIGLPLPGQSGTQETNFGSQDVGEQSNDADVTQEQGNENLNISPAIGILGDAETTNAQGNDNYASSDVEQENDVDQSLESTQEQSLTQSGSTTCCSGQSQTGEQTTYGGDQSVDEQKNDADVTQEQGNGNVNVSPAIAIFGDAETTNEQGNDNVAKSDVDQSNDVDQSQSSTQRQDATQSGGSCCESKAGYGTYEKDCCADGQSQAGEQRVYGGDQSVEKQKNDADVTQKQGNGNLNVAPAIAFFGDARTSNYQGNGNVATSEVDQKNDVDQTQSSQQKQSLVHEGGDCCGPTYECRTGCEAAEGHGHKPSSDCSRKCEPAKDSRRCCDSSQSGEQQASFGDQYVGKQENDADVTQKQGNWNESFAPAIALGGLEKHACSSKCEPARYSGNHTRGGAETANFQGNGNVATSEVDQRNEVDQSQAAYQRQSLVDRCTGLIKR